MSGVRGKLIVIAAIGLFLGFVSWQWFLSPKAGVNRCLQAAAAAAEETDLEAVLFFFSSDYRDDQGNGLESLEELLRKGFASVDRLNVTVESLEVEPMDEGMLARFDLMVVAIRGEERFILVGMPMQPEKVSALLRKEGGEWKLLEVKRRS